MIVPLILVTRPGGEDDPLVATLRGRGLRVTAAPTVAIDRGPAEGPLERAAGDPARWDWIVVTSARAVAALVAAAARGGPTIPLAEWPTRWAAVGKETAAALRRAGVSRVAVPARQQGLAIADLIAGEDDLRDRRILLPRASEASGDLPDRLIAAGAVVEEVIAYTTVIGPATSGPVIATALADPDLALGVVASGSAVAGLLRLAERAGPVAVARARGLPLVSIGPATSAAVDRHGLHLAAEAERPDVPAVADAVLAWLRRRPVGVAP